MSRSAKHIPKYSRCYKMKQHLQTYASLVHPIKTLLYTLTPLVKGNLLKLMETISFTFVGIEEPSGSKE